MGIEQTGPVMWTIDLLGDLPGHVLYLTECQYPDCIDGGYSITLTESCATHARSVYWCLNTGVLWCDGGPPEWESHNIRCGAYAD